MIDIQTNSLEKKSPQLRILCQLRMYHFFHALLFGFITLFRLLHTF